MNKKICMKCGVSFECEWEVIKYCDACSVAIAEEAKETKRVAAAKRQWEILVPIKYRETDIHNHNYQKQIEVHKEALKWCKSGSKAPFLGIIGSHGKCKTRIIAQALKWFINKKKSAQWLNAIELQRAIQTQFNDLCQRDAWETLKEARNTSVLVIDDLGQMNPKNTVAEELHLLLERRSSNRMLTLWTSNTLIDDLFCNTHITQEIRGSIIRRLNDYSKILKVK